MKYKILSQINLPGGDTINAPENVPSVESPESLAGIISWIIIVLTSIGVIASLIFLILGAIKWITSGGDKDKLENARRTIIFSIIGLVVVLLSVMIMNFIGNILGINVLQSITNNS